ncbi:uncharacterized protein LOC101900382 [Musca domestica]|uniref:Uncharacterized protein LOC101900382 n=1 Tax=Musca domestica TaxID=7370 RepID=A0A9J7DF49_MUSDO|nr:uncharacterized protein LOC101900382 [Musca domestica]
MLRYGNKLEYIFISIVLITFAYETSASPLPGLNKKYEKNNHTGSSQFSGLQQLRILRHLIKECENSSSNSSATIKTWQCLKVTSLYLFDDVTSRDVVPVWRGVRFVRLSPKKSNYDASNAENDLYNDSQFWKRKDTQYLTWFDRLALSFRRLLWTHKLEIDLKEVMDAYMEYRKENDNLSNSNSSDPIGTARHRRHRYNMMLTMMFGVTAFGAVLVPMGFQLLSVVSGKALLLAKMALLLASINGLKRVANSGLHYGLYHVPGEHYGGYYDRGDVHHPRNVQNLLTPSNQMRGVPLEVGISVK